MTTATKTRIADCHETTTLNDETVILVPANAGTGAFSKPASKSCETPEQALAATRRDGGDKIIKQVNSGRWQAWERRRVVGRVQTVSGGTRAKRKSAGSGTIYFQPVN